MAQSFQPNGRATLIGSQPLREHGAACDLIMEYTPDIPTWPQLPAFPHEGMVAQFMAGMPGLVQEGTRHFIDTTLADFDDQVLAFFEAFLEAQASGDPASTSRFVLTPDVAQGFFSLKQTLETASVTPAAVKGQITGPITFCMSLKDQEGRAIFYNDTLRDAAVKQLALKAAWQIGQLESLARPVILFLDEPSLAGFGASEMISISREDVLGCLREVVDAVHARQGLAGVHVCANTDWSLLFDAGIDVVNFDAYGYFDKFVLYGDAIRRYLLAGHYLAWGLVPTLDVEALEGATEEGLWADWQAKSRSVGGPGRSPGACPCPGIDHPQLRLRRVDP